jgi:hypothetical protein
MYYTSYHLTTSAAEERGHMSKRQHSCSFCHQVSMSEATYANIGIRHRILISLRLLFLVARSRRLGKLRRSARWWK